MNPQKNQGAEDSPLLRDLQAEVSSESAPMLQFMLQHAGTIASIVVLFVLVLAGTGIWRWYTTSKNDDARQALARIVLQTSGPDQIKQLTAAARESLDDLAGAGDPDAERVVSSIRTRLAEAEAQLEQLEQKSLARGETPEVLKRKELEAQLEARKARLGL